MNSSDALIIFGGLATIILLPIVAIAGLFIYSRVSQARFQAVVAMDGATCAQTKAGSVMIRPTRLSNILAFIFFALLLVGLIALALSSWRTVTLSGVIYFGAIALFLVSITYHLGRLLLKPGVYLNSATQELEIGRGDSRRVIPFAEIDQVVIGTVEGQSGSRRNRISKGAVGVRLNDGEIVQLGTLSGSKRTVERTETAAQMIADTVGVGIQSNHQKRT